jgi:hypothetical protein
MKSSILFTVAASYVGLSMRTQSSNSSSSASAEKVDDGIMGAPEVVW